MINNLKPFRAYVFLSVLLILLLSGCASKTVEATPSAQPTRDPNVEQTIEKQLQKIDSAAIPVYQEATNALDKGDYEKSKGLYEQVIVIAPGFSTAYRRLGYIELSLNNIERAEELTRKALALEPNSYNQSSLAIILLQKNTPKDSQEAYDLATSAAKSLPDDEQALMALMMSAAAINNLEVVRASNARLLEADPNNPLVHYFAGLLSANDRKWEKAESELLYSQNLGMPSEAVQHALSAGIARNAWIARFLRWSSIAAVFWLLGLGVLFLAGTYLSRATMQALNIMEPAVDFQARPTEHRIRSIYKFVITVLSLFFYISIPFAILLLLVVVGGAFYIFFLIGSIPVQFALILVLMLFASLFAIVRSLFWRMKDVPPGRELKRIDAPELWTLVEDVARKLDVKPVDAIYVTPWAGIAVYERGSILQKLRGTGKRNLILGMGAMPGLTQSQLTAILAHEYGHFSNRDTAGGDLAHQVYASLYQMAQRLFHGGAAQVFNPVWLFVLGYQRIFLRITLGASRLQEILADRYAAVAYGGQNFIEGLQNVIRQGIAFPLQTDYEIRRSFDLNRPIYNLYDLPFEEKLQGEMEKQIDEAMVRTTSQYDSHPAPKERIELIERLRIPYSAVQDNRLPALRLFPNPEELQRELTAQLMINIRKQSG
jgi:Zn-dependent protease with chaperone function/tetratricopeptide (TPR) repeat protein